MTRDVNPMIGNCNFSSVIASEIRKHFGEPHSIIELGCGSGGNLSEFLAADILVGIDPYLCNVEKARKTIKKENIILGDHLSLDRFNSNQFEVGYTCSVLDHMEDFSLALSKLCYVCKKVMLFEPTIVGKERQAKESETGCWRTSWYHDYYSWLSKSELYFTGRPYQLYSSSSGRYFHQFIIYSENYTGKGE